MGLWKPQKKLNIFFSFKLLCSTRPGTQGYMHEGQMLYHWGAVFLVLTVTWRSENNLWELVISFHHVGSRKRTQGPRLGPYSLCPLSHLASSLFYFFPLGWLVSPSLQISITEAQNVIPKVSGSGILMTLNRRTLQESQKLCLSSFCLGSHSHSLQKVVHRNK